VACVFLSLAPFTLLRGRIEGLDPDLLSGACGAWSVATSRNCKRGRGEGEAEAGLVGLSRSRFHLWNYSQAMMMARETPLARRLESHCKPKGLSKGHSGKRRGYTKPISEVVAAILSTAA